MAVASVARVCIDSPLPHLDRLFDYAVPDKWRGRATVGARARVRFAGRLINAVIVEVGDTSEFAGKLTALNSVAGTASYTPTALSLARAVADRYAGSLWDVLRLMAPPRVASVEKRDWSDFTADPQRYADAADDCDSAAAKAGLAPWSADHHGRVVWEVPPDRDAPAAVPARALLAAPLAVAASGRTAIVVVPDARAIATLEHALAALGLTRWTARSGGDYTVLDHDDGQAPRYGSYLAGMHGHVNLVIGTRPAALQPVPHLGLIALWDDGSTVYEDPHAPYLHARTVAAMRVGHDGAGLLLASYTPSVDAAALVAHGFAHHTAPDRATVRERSAAVDVLTDERRDAEGGAGWHWMPGSAWRALTRAVAQGPVAVMVPRAGYVHALACARCGEWAACAACGGTLRTPRDGADPVCSACETVHAHWHCPECHGAALKHVRQGVERVTEQLRSMARGWPVHASTAAVGPLPDFSVEEGLVVATPGALPAVQGGYRHIVVVGAQVPAGGTLGAEMAGVRLWLNTAALASARGDGGGVTLVGDMPDAVRRALTTWTPWELARGDYTERAELGLPPARRVVQVQGGAAVLDTVTGVVDEGTRTGRWAAPTLIDGEGTLTVLVSRGDAHALTSELRRQQQEFSRAGGPELRLRVDGPLRLPH